MLTQVHNADHVHSAINVVAGKLASLNTNVPGEVVAFNDRGLSLQTRLQMLFTLKFQDQLQQQIYETILTHAFAAENLGPGSFDFCIRLVTDALFKKDSDNHTLLKKASFEQILRYGAMVPVVSDVDWIVDTFASVDQHVIDILKQAFVLAGFAGRIVLEKSVNESASIELVRGYTFAIDCGFKLSKKFVNPRIVAIDGFIEGVHEINGLLEQASERKEPVILFVRGLHDDVLHTLKVNYDRGRLMVIPIIVKFDLEGLNTLADVAIVSAADLKSTTKGNLISSVNLDDSPLVDAVSVYKHQVVISNDKTVIQVHNHVVHLREKRIKEHDSTAEFLDKRIKSLSPNHVVVRLPNDRNFVKNSQAIDYVLRTYKSLITHGKVFVDNKPMLASTAAAIYVHSNRCLETLNSLGAAIT